MVDLSQLQPIVDLLNSSRYVEAIADCRRLLAGHEGDAEVLSLLGLCLTHAGRGAEGLAALIQAADLQAENQRIQLNLAFGLSVGGRYEEAESRCREVLRRDAGNARALELLGDIAQARSDPAAASRYWHQSIERRFTLPAAVKWIRNEIRQSRFDQAEIALSDLASRYADRESIHDLHCELLAAKRDWPALEKVARYVTGRFPGGRMGWKWLAIALLEAGLYTEACTAFRRALEIGSPDADELAAYAGLCVHALDFDEAGATLDRATAMDPENPAVLQRLAVLHLYHGRFTQAEDCSRRCLARDPENVSAYTTLTRVRRGRLSDAELSALARIAGRADAPIETRIAAAFAAGHVHDARGDIDAAMQAYGHAHDLARERDRIEGRVYRTDASEARAARFPAQLDLAPLPAPAPGSPRPIFIVGMPRSGTTLVECVLGAHPAVAAGGERMAMREVLHAWLALCEGGNVPDAATLSAWRDSVLAGMRWPDGMRCFTDKHPLNFEAVGLIARLFPDAAIVWMRRDALETGLSIYRQEFNKRWGFVHRLADIGHFYGLQERVMRRWIERLPGRVVEIRYEDFAGDIASGARTLLEVVGLEWDPRCLEFQSQERPIATFSAVDARDPVKVQSGRAARYRRHLGDLLAALSAAGPPRGAGEGVRQNDPVAG